MELLKTVVGITFLAIAFIGVVVAQVFINGWRDTLVIWSLVVLLVFLITTGIYLLTN